ncbi:citramalate synthase [Paenibacillus chitinolyticus]|uniref:citramalate synthase n=1 Tax=Paenibacillus chitinolyticus TaxID=79263 RepID=UPI00367069AF
MDNRITILDTTLRDGTQGEGVSLTVEDKLKIAKRLDMLGISFIEGGWPGSNHKDAEFFIRARELNLQQARITAFGSTRRKNIPAEHDANLRQLLDIRVGTAAIFGKSWDFQVQTAIQTTLFENLNMIEDTVRFLKRSGIGVIYDAEHFFDGYKSNRAYAMSTIRKAYEAGADWIVLCDTNGGTLPHEIAAIVASVKEQLDCPLGIHAHNDCELAVANTIAAVMAGAAQVQGTINGYGERCGNANLISVIPNLQLKLGLPVITAEQLAGLTSTARYVSEIANMHMPVNQPFAGHAAFAHKGGVHVSAILRDSSTYEHIAPGLVGNRQRVLVSELSGQSNLVFKAQELGLELEANDPNTKILIERVKELEHQGYQFDGADASLELLIRSVHGNLEEILTLESFKITVVKSVDQAILSEAVVKVKVHGESVYNAAEGNGPINALDNALRKCLMQHYPSLQTMHLSDYKVRVLDDKDGTATKVRVLIEFSDREETWSTVGVSENIIEASWQALCDSIRYALQDVKPALNKRAEGAKEAVGLVNH